MSTISLIYIVLAISHYVIQLILSILYQYTLVKSKVIPNEKKSVLIIIPGYKEDYKSLIKTIESCKNAFLSSKFADLNKSQIIYIEDDAPNSNYQQVKEYFQESSPINIQITCNGKNLGKREAQWTGYQVAGFIPDYILTVDSDTFLRPSAIDHLLCSFNKEEVGAVTGNITIVKKRNTLQHLISLRYFLAFNQERASQSIFGEVLCCSGPLTMYRGYILDNLFERYISQEYAGKKCTFGDDRHLTNLVLESGYKTKYDAFAIASTGAPATIKTYLKQQYRWSKSFFREAFYSAKNILISRSSQGRLFFRFYSFWEILIGTALPLLLLANIVEMMFKTVIDPFTPIRYVAVIFLIAYFRAVYGMLNDNLNPKDWYFAYPLYAVVNLFLLIPIRIKALFTLADTRWGTR